MVKFEAELSKNIIETVNDTKYPEYRGYLQQFGHYNVTDISAKDVSSTEIANFLLNGIDSLKAEIRLMKAPSLRSSPGPKTDAPVVSDRSPILIEIKGLFDEKIVALQKRLTSMSLVYSVELYPDNLLVHLDQRIGSADTRRIQHIILNIINS